MLFHILTSTKYIFLTFYHPFAVGGWESPLEALFQMCSEIEGTNEALHAMTHCK